MTQDQATLFGLLIFVFVFLIWGRWRYDLVAFVALLIALLTGIVPKELAFSGFGHPATIIIALVLIVSRGLSNSGAIELVARYIVDASRKLATHITVMAGFAAAIYQRGVDFVQVPTTLLSQVDSSVGGKTGVNHPLGKNMIGAFHQPRCVIADTDTLDTLPDRELSAGLAEVIKYGVINDLAFFEWLESNMERLPARETAALIHAVRRSCHDKAIIVAADEREAGQRALLNLGHTFGHAIESGMGYGKWLHGEAVAAGIAMAAAMSVRLGWLEQAECDRIRALLQRARLPVDPPPEISGERFIELMSVDKKVLNGELRLVLLRGIGEALVTADYPLEVLRQSLAA